MANIDFYLNLLNNREKAIVLWVIIFFVWVLFNKKVRDSLRQLLGELFQIKIISVIVTMILYNGIVVYALYKIHFWDVSLIKETFVWTFGTAFVIFFDIVIYKKDDHFFRKVILDNLKFVLVIELITNLYSFNLLVEIIIVPLLVFVFGMSAIADMDKKYLPVTKIFNFVFFLLGILYISFFLYNVIEDYSSFFSVHNFKSFLLPILLMFCYLPFLYLFALIMTYEEIFVRIKFFLKDNKLVVKFAKRRIFMLCLLNLRKLNDFAKESTIDITNLRGKNKKDILEIIKKFESKRNTTKDKEK